MQTKFFYEGYNEQFETAFKTWLFLHPIESGPRAQTLSGDALDRALDAFSEGTGSVNITQDDSVAVSFIQKGWLIQRDPLDGAWCVYTDQSYEMGWNVSADTFGEAIAKALLDTLQRGRYDAELAAARARFVRVYEEAKAAFDKAIVGKKEG